MKKIIAFILIIILLIVLLISLLISSTAGLKLSIRVINATTQTDIQYQTVSGTLLGPIKFTNLNACQSSACMTSNSLSINWKLSDLLLKHLTINNIIATDATLTFKKTTSKKKKKSKKNNIPTMTIKNMDINQLTITLPNKKTIQLKNIKLNTLKKTPTTQLQLTTNITQPVTLSTQITASGTVDNYTINAIATNPTTDIQLTGTGNQDQISLTTTHAKIAKGSIQSDINAQWSPSWTWKLNTTIEHVQPKLLNNNWPSQLNASIQSTGTFSQHDHEASLTAQAKTAYSELSLSGNLGPTSNLAWSLTSGQLSELGNRLSGQLESSGHITGNNLKPLITGTISGNNITMKQRSIQSLTSKFSINFNTAESSSLSLSANRIQWGSTKLNSYDVTADGTLSHYTLTTQASDKQGNLNLSLIGQQDKGYFKNTIKTLSIQSNDFGHWVMTQPITLQASPTLLQIDNLCLKETTDIDSDACVALNYQYHKPWQASITASHINAHTLTQSLLPSNTSLSGDLALSASISGLNKVISDMDINANMNNGALKTTQNITNQTIPFSTATSKVTYHKQQLSAGINLTQDKQNFLQASLLANDIQSITQVNPNQTINGSLKLQATQLAPYSPFFPAVNLSKGQLNVDLSISGPINTPSMEGQASLSQLVVTSPKIGLSLSNINLNINSKGKETTYNGSISSGNAALDITGQTLFSQPGWPSQLQITGSNFPLLDSDIVTININPNINVKTLNTDISISGDVAVPTGTIAYEYTPNVVSLPMSDIQFASNKKSQSSPWKTTINTQVTFGKDVNVDILGVKGKATGAVNVTKKKKQNQLYGTGQITINGTYLAYGHKLSVDPNSTLIFNDSPIINPTLNLSASKRITNTTQQGQQNFDFNSIKVGVQLTGSIDDPKLSLYAVPNTLSTSDILSYLILGHLSTTIASSNNTLDTNSASNNSNQSFANIIDTSKLIETGLSGSQSAGFSNTLQHSLGISELGIQTNSSVDVLGNEIDQEDYFVVGKFIAPKLYVKYSQGLLYNDDILQLRYFITPHWILQTESARSTSIDNSSGVDILYSR